MVKLINCYVAMGEGWNVEVECLPREAERHLGIWPIDEKGDIGRSDLCFAAQPRDHV